MRHFLRALPHVLSIGVLLGAGPAQAVDWPALEKAHDGAMSVYAQAPKSNRYSAQVRAREALEKAGATAAIAETPTGVSTQKAAAILNDYGFLLAATYRDYPLAEQALRRAMVLDPQRKIAVLNLADVLQRQLGDAPDLKAKQTSATEVESLYRRYLELGGKSTPMIQSYLARNWSREQSSDPCEAVASYANAGRVKELLLADIAIHDNGPSPRIWYQQRWVKVKVDIQGTGYFPYAFVYDAVKSKPDDNASAVDIDADGNDDLGLMVYRDRALLIQLQHNNVPVAVYPLSGKPAVCSFATHATEQPAPTAKEPELCHRLIAGNVGNTIKFKASGPAKKTSDSDDAEYGDYTDAQARVDFANRGQPLPLIERRYDAQGMNCQPYTSYVLPGTGPSHTADKQLLQELVGAGDEPDCGGPVNPRFFSYQGHVYYEDADNTVVGSEHHYIKRILAGKVEEVCNFQFTHAVTYKEAKPFKVQ